MATLLGIGFSLLAYVGIGLALAFRATQGDPMRFLRALWSIGLSERGSGGIALLLWVVFGALAIVVIMILYSFIVRET
jgi:hypothetical protein